MNTLCTQTNQAKLPGTSAYCDTSVSSGSHQKRRYLHIPASIWSALKNTVVRKYNQRIDRAAFNYLLTLDDGLLSDIGVTRQDVYWASRLPLEVDAARKIEEIARRR